MPSIAAHFACAGLVYKKIKNKISDKDKFYIGCILPDIIDLEGSHLKVKGKYYLVPDIEKYKKESKVDGDIKKGYLCHLLLDKYFLDEYVIKNIRNYDKINLFSSNMIYNDYTSLNAVLVNDFNIDLNYINKVIRKIPDNFKVQGDKYKLNVESINNLDCGEITFIDIDKFKMFIKEISLRIAEDIMR
ncbi:MAG: hypothetical protein HFI86_04185 [Bacilli bacterium]|nr:hypothetical protein [Bacilli bacterium]